MPSLIQYLEARLPGKGPLRERITTDGTYDLVLEKVRGLQVVTTHYSGLTQRSFTIAGLSRGPADKVAFEKEGHYVQLGDYYWRKHKVKLQATLPCGECSL